MKDIKTIEDISNLIKTCGADQVDWKEYGDVNVTVAGDLVLFNYNASAQFSDRWNDFEVMARGLLFDTDGNVVARTFDKFFNYGQGGRYPSRDTHLVSVFEKMDGSMIGTYYRDGHAMCYTRGSLQSDQAKWATEYLNRNYPNIYDSIPTELTLIFEVIAPSVDRHIVDYGSFEGFVLLAVRNCQTGQYLPYSGDDYNNTVFGIANKLNIPLPKIYPISDFNDAHKIYERATDTNFQSEEGWVLLYSDGSRFKVKTDTYLHLHRLLSHTSEKKMYRHYINGTLGRLLSEIPDEFSDMRQRVIDFQHEMMLEENSVYVELAQYTITADEMAVRGASRKEYAQFVNASVPPHLRGIMFGYDISNGELSLISNRQKETVLEIAWSRYQRQNERE